MGREETGNVLCETAGLKCDVVRRGLYYVS